MWIMTSFGILMPAAINENDPHYLEWDLQVRSRERRALTYFQTRYMPANTFTPVRATPSHDYDFRFYAERTAFADAVAELITEIDYEKFKPTTLRRNMGGDRLHQLYNAIWAKYLDAFGTDNIYTNLTKRNLKRKGTQVNDVRYPDIRVKLVGTDGNAGAIVGAVAAALRKAKISNEVIAEFRTEAMSGNYDHLLATCMRWVDVH